MRIFLLDKMPSHRELDSMGAVAIRSGLAKSMEELWLAEHLAKKSLATKTSIAKSLRFEFLLWLSGRTDIRTALKEEGPGKGGRCLVVVFDDNIATDNSWKTAKLKEKAEPLDLERISVSRIKN